jgi:hypothetical protein
MFILCCLLSVVCSHRYLHADVILFTKLCRVIAHTLKLPTEGVVEGGTHSTLTPELETILADVLIPAYSLIPSNVAVANDLWCDIHTHTHTHTHT